MAVRGAGPIGKRHIEHVANEDCADLIAIVDPSPDTEALANRMDVAWYPTFAAMVREDKPERVIAATPNQMHVENGLEAVGDGVAVLAEKPIACERLPVAAQDPLGLQVRNFCGVIRGTAQPVVPCRRAGPPAPG